MPFAVLRRFAASGSAGGIVLALAALLALAVANSPLAPWYQALLDVRGEVAIGNGWLVVSKPFVLWVNDLLMAVFFFVVGLEIKRELLEGELASIGQAVLPAVAALGGMVVPALLYAAVNHADAAAMRGWAVPMATDIAFALGVLALLGERVAPGLRVFLTAVAIIDDLGAIVVIAIFYTDELSQTMLVAAGVWAVVLLALNRVRVAAIGPYAIVGLAVWVCVLKSGVHATLAGVVTALAVPMRDRAGGSPLRRAEHALHPWVAYAILPIFAFANAGVALGGVGLSTLFGGIPLGIALGLVAGKTIGVCGAAAALVSSGRARLPEGADWTSFLGACVLCGIGFTMSLFIGGLAFDGLDARYEVELKLGVLGGSLLAALLGTALLLRPQRTSRQVARRQGR
jgi:NhaA family Na+:H+ antiporter